MEQFSNQLTIGSLAREANVSVETIRFYQRKNLLSEPDRSYGSIRRYGAKEVSRVRFIKSAQRMGFTLEEVAQLLQLEDGTHCAHQTDCRAKIDRCASTAGGFALHGNGARRSGQALRG